MREKGDYKIEKVHLRDLAIQRFQFTPRLMAAAGYSGWVLLIDEIEMIGRYTFRQRAKSYAELARWMGKLEGASFPGITAICAINNDFENVILEGKEDMERVPGKLRDRVSESDLLLASQAERGMRIIQRERIPLKAADNTVVERTRNKIRSVYASAYDWEPPTVSSINGLVSTRMREYVKGWITEWDLKRLDPEGHVDIEITEMKQDYTEDPNLHVSSEEEHEGGS